MCTAKKTAIHSQKSQTGRIDPQHKELVKYIHETWKCVKKEYESDGVASATACLVPDKSAKSAPRRSSLVTKSKSEFWECNPFVFSNCFSKCLTFGMEQRELRTVRFGSLLGKAAVREADDELNHKSLQKRVEFL